jgi:hypothetical protein
MGKQNKVLVFSRKGEQSSNNYYAPRERFDFLPVVLNVVSPKSWLFAHLCIGNYCIKYLRKNAISEKSFNFAPNKHSHRTFFAFCFVLQTFYSEQLSHILNPSDLSEDYLNMDDDWDNISVASLAVPTNERIKTDDASSKNNSQSSDDQDSPEALVSAKNDRNVGRVKRTFLVLLVAAGIGLSVAAYLTQDEDDEGDGEEQDDDENNGLLYAGVIGATFFVLVIVFLRYDFLVSRRQSLVLDMAKRSKHIVDSLFPSMVRDRLMRDAEGRRSSNSSKQSDEEFGEVDFAKLTRMNTMANQRMQDSSNFALPLPLTESPTKVNKILAVNVESFKNVESSRNAVEKDGKPIADLYPSATVFFADIAGFTAWSAEREPTQVFTLLETVYNEFDQMADQLGVFKVSGRCAESCWPIVYCAPAWQSSHSTI